MKCLYYPLIFCIFLFNSRYQNFRVLVHDKLKPPLQANLEVVRIILEVITLSKYVKFQTYANTIQYYSYWMGNIFAAYVLWVNRQMPKD